MYRAPDTYINIFKGTDEKLKEIATAEAELVTTNANHQDTCSWSLAAIIDELAISLLDTKVAFCMINSNQKMNVNSEEAYGCNIGTGVLRRLYEEQARYKMYRVPVFRPPPVFAVYLKHLDDRLKKELANLDKESKDFVMRDAIGRICEQVNKQFFLLSVKPLLKWRLQN
jgi:hypothetical protein